MQNVKKFQLKLNFPKFKCLSAIDIKKGRPIIGIHYVLKAGLVAYNDIDKITT